MPSDPLAAAADPGVGVALGAVVVTGGSSGLGRAVADAVARAGGTPVVLDLEPPDSGHDHEVVDLADTAAAEAAIAAVAERHGGLHGIVTAAGTDACGKLTDVPRERWERGVLVNLLGTAPVVRAGPPPLQASQGRVVTGGSPPPSGGVAGPCRHGGFHARVAGAERRHRLLRVEVRCRRVHASADGRGR